MNLNDLKTDIDHKNEQVWQDFDCDPSHCLPIINECLTESQRIEYEKGTGEALINRGRMNFHLLNYQQALADFQEAQRYFPGDSWNIGKVRLFDQTGLVNAALGEFNKAIDCYQESLRGSRICQNTEMEITVQTNLGNTYLTAQEYQKAIPFFSELEKKLPENDRLNRISTYNSLAETYTGLQKFDNALEYVEKALQLERSDRDRIKMIESLEIKGRILAGLGDFQQATKTFQASITLCDLISHKSGKAQILYSMGKTFLSAGMHDLAIQHIQLSTALFDELESKIFLTKAYKVLALAYEKKGDFEQALLFQKLYFTYNTELLKKENAKKIENMYIARELERIEEKAERLSVTNSILVEENSRMKILMEIGQKITSSLDLKRLFKPLYNQLTALMECNCFGIGIYQEAEKTIDYDMFIVNGKKMAARKLPCNPEVSLGAWCILNGHDIFIDDMEAQWKEYFSEKPVSRNKKSRSMLYVPLNVEDRILGYITIQSNQSYAYTEADLGTLKILSSYIAIAMENSKIHSEMQKLYLDIIKEHKDLEASYKDIELIAVRDKLTGLYNRQYLEQLIENEFPGNKRVDPYCVLYLDLDSFKPVNDEFGHFTGDKVLKEIAGRMQQCMRQSDELIRIGGDEFIAIVRRTPNRNAAARVADKIMHELEKPVKIGNIRVKVGISIGISVYPENGRNIKEMIEKADIAMYEVKNSGKFAFRFFSA
ncbi:MAG: diguanylate cyclase [Spirochaetales bacterium]|nr:diguanylate cyclase [Spirochaetales bacterium]